MTPEKRISPISSALLVLIFLQAVCGICAAGEPGSFPFLPDPSSGSTSCPEGELVFAPQNPHFLDYHERSFEGAGLLTLDGSRHLYGYAPSPVDLSHLRADPGFQAPARGSRYDLRDYGRVTPVKDQGNYGTCWAFASLASLESAGVPAFGARDYSEKHMANLDGFDYTVNEGGNKLMATAYLTRWGGPVYEKEDPYPGNFKWTASPAGLTERVHCQEVLFLPSDITRMKEAVVEKGALYTGFRVNVSSFAETPSSTSYYYNGSSDLQIEGGHAVLIVGWDDTFDRSKFATAPPDGGAFICKNSWGTDWGDNGHFYLSYYDDSFSTSVAQPAVFTAEPTTNYDNIYQYDPYGWTSSCKVREPGEWAYAANVFRAAGNEKVAAAGFYTPTIDSEYSISIYRGQETLTTQNGTIEDAGFHTIALDNPVRVGAGETFTVCLALKTPGYEYPIIIEKPIAGYSSNADASPGESYVSSDGVTWIDVSAQDMNVCLKAYTRSIPPPDFTANVTGGPIPLTVRFTDTTTDDPTSWSWDFGDGSSATDQNPTHTYTLPGNYTVTLSVDGGISTATKPRYIKATPVLFGDANEDGEVNQADTLIVLQEVVGLRETPTAGTDRFCKTDVHANGVIEVGDALFIAQYNVGLRDVWFEAL